MGKYKASKVETGLQAQQIALAQRQQALAEEQHTWWKGLYAPVEQKLVQQYSKPVEEQSYFKRMIGDVEKQYGDITGQTRSALGGRYQYGSGYEGQAAKNLALSKAGTRAGAWQAAEEARLGGLMGLAGLGRGSETAAQQGLASATSATGSIVDRLANLRATKAGQQTSATTSCLCRKFIAGNELTKNVVEFRDMFFKPGSFIDQGYKFDSMLSVPLMKNRAFKFLTKWLCLKPLGAYADFFFGKNRYGFLLSPIGFFWIGLWIIFGMTIAKLIDLSGSERKFQEEVAQWACSNSYSQ